MSILSCLWVCELYRVGRLHPPGHSLRAALSRDLYVASWPYLLLWAVSLAARGKITVSGIPDRLSYCVIFVIYT